MQNKKKKLKTRKALSALLFTLLVSLLVVLNPNSFETSLEKSDFSDSPASTALEPVENSSKNSSDSAVEPLGQSANKSGTSSESPAENSESSSEASSKSALEVLESLQVKGRASKSGYARTEFYNSWPSIDGCSLRQRIIKRELGSSAVISSEDNCTVVSGEFIEPYTGAHMIFYERADLTKGIQIDHVVALSDAWQKGAQKLTKERRYELATDPLNLLAVNGSANQSKSDGDAATWLPPNKSFRCAYIARQISVKFKYSLWVTSAEKSAMETVLKTCPNEPAVGV
ncbi:HNH endonuclease [Candidatus Saccharibacteria bacterium]|nr:HNH endonuclease [Candidatus Saccharibacteria bacterium]